MITKTKIHFAPSYFQNPSHKLSVLLIGCGGTGSQVLTCLARINTTLIALDHPGLNVTVIDADTVSPTNIGRQLFSPSDIGRPKSEVMVERINRFFNLNWQSDLHRFCEQTKITANITISCVDNIPTRKLIAKEFNLRRNSHNDRCKVHYWMDFGNSNTSGQVVLASRQVKCASKFEQFTHVEKLPSIFQLFPAFKNIKEKDTGPSCSVAESIKNQDLFINSTLAQLGCNLLWKLIKEGSLEHHGVFLNLKTMNVKPIKIK